MGIPLPLLSSPRGLAGGREEEEDFLGKKKKKKKKRPGGVPGRLSVLRLQPDQGWVFPLVFTDTDSPSRQSLPVRS